MVIRWRFLQLLLIILIVGVGNGRIQAQTPDPTPPPDSDPIPQVHTVQAGENLTFIAQTYGVTVEELLTVNGLTEEDILFAGQALFIPGGEGEAVATVYTAQLGDSFESVAAAFNTTLQAVFEANSAINSQYEFVVGQTVAVISRTGSALPQTVNGTPHIVGLGETLNKIAAQHNISPMALAAENDLPYPTIVTLGQRLRIPSEELYRYLPGTWVDVEIRPLPLIQGGTVSIYVENLLDGQPSGQFAGQSLRFFPYEDGFAALVGIDAFTDPGEYALRLEGSGSRPWQPFQQNVPIQSGNYGTQLIEVSEELAPLLAPEVRREEDVFLSTFYTEYTEDPLWEGVFQVPVTNTVVTAPYGDGRSYNGGPITIYHSGIDFSGTIGTPILSPANGTIVFTGDLELRGQAVIIDHGVGIMSAYFHLSEIFVSLGDSVAAGTPIGAGGSTGLSTGPHLHWDLRIMDVPVDGDQWLTSEFP